ncbi:MAG: chalcone isomerase family protein [Deltaproteobacteria bacterium]|nr:chalcone isomerase family protein [Deltaproteobacteria bacterium]MBI3391535.1 chalcone isomerase family protein [Deltaproteobacteria bacterium]
MQTTGFGTGVSCSRRRLAARIGTFIAAALIASASRFSRAAEIEGVTFSDRVETHGTVLRLNCTGLLRYMVVIKGYVAALYLAPGEQPDEVLSDLSKRLEINYFYAIKGLDFTEATDRGIAANVDAATAARLRPRIDQLNALYEDVRPGDRYSLTYVPGAGTELALNGTPKGTIAGADFAAALFAIWLGPHALDDSLKSQLLHCS